MGVATNITWWAILHLKAFPWSCLPLEEIARECLLAQNLACDQKLQLGMGELGRPPCFLLSAGKAREMGTRVSAEITKPEAATPKTADSTTLDLNCHSKES